MDDDEVKIKADYMMAEIEDNTSNLSDPDFKLVAEELVSRLQDRISYCK